MSTTSGSSRRSFLQMSGCAAAIGTLGLPAAMVGATSPLRVDKIVHGGRVYTMSEDRMVYPDGAIAIRGADIVAVGPTQDVLSGFTADEKINASGHMVMPGFIDTHLHPALSFYRQEAPGDASGFSFVGNYDTYDNRRPISGMSFNADVSDLVRFLGMTRLVDKIPTSMTYAFSRYSMLIAMRGGATTFVEGGGGTADGVAEAARSLGMRACIANSVLDLAVDNLRPGEAPVRIRDTDEQLAWAEAAYKRWHGAEDGLIQGWYNLITDVTSSNELIAGIAALSRRDDAAVASHTAATNTQDKYSQLAFGKRGVERIAEGGLMDVHWLGIHMGFISDEDIELMRARNSCIAHCPGTSSFTGKGIIRDKQIMNAMRAGVPVGLGSDTIGYGNILQQLRLAYTGHKEAFGDNRVLPPYRVLELATVEAAKCARLQGMVGQLAPGMKADLILVDIDTPEYAQRTEPVEKLIRIGSATDIRTSIINGEVIMRDREFDGVDEEDIIRDMRTSSALMEQKIASS